MKHIDEIQIAGTALLLCGAMLAVSVVAPDGNTISKAVTNFIEAPETAAEAQAQAENAGFPIYTQESNYSHEENVPISYDTYGSYDTTADSGSENTDTSNWEDTQPDNSTSPDLPDDIAPEDDPTQIIYPSEPSDDLVDPDEKDTWEDTNDDWEVFPDESFPEDSQDFYYDNTDNYENE